MYGANVIPKNRTIDVAKHEQSLEVVSVSTQFILVP